MEKACGTILLTFVPTLSASATLFTRIAYSRENLGHIRFDRWLERGRCPYEEILTLIREAEEETENV